MSSHLTSGTNKAIAALMSEIYTRTRRIWTGVARYLSILYDSADGKCRSGLVKGRILKESRVWGKPVAGRRSIRCTYLMPPEP